MERITHAAIFFRNEYYLGRRHQDCVEEIIDETGVSRVPESAPRGFWTSKGRFLNRKDGAKFALASGQIKRLRFHPQLLFSEDLW